MLRGAERVWPPSGARGSVAVPNGEGVASGGATRVLKKSCNISQKFKNLRVFRQSPFARKALCTTGRAGPLACAAAAVYPAIHKSRPAAAQKISLHIKLEVENVAILDNIILAINGKCDAANIYRTIVLI